MDYAYLNEEIQTLNEYSKTSLLMIGKFYNFLKKIHKTYTSTNAIIMTCLEDFKAEIKREKIYSTIQTAYKDYVSNFQEYILKNNKLLEQFESEILESITSFSTNESKKNTELIGEFNKLSDYVNQNKLSFEKSKNAYFLSVKEEIGLMKSLNKSSSKSEHKHKKNEENLEKMKQNKNLCEKDYKESLEVMDNCLKESEASFSKLIKSYKDDERAKLTFVEFYISKLNKYVIDQQTQLKEFYDKTSKSHKSLNINRDMDTLENVIDSYKKNGKEKRLPSEEFINLDDFYKNFQKNFYVYFEMKNKYINIFNNSTNNDILYSMQISHEIQKIYKIVDRIYTANEPLIQSEINDINNFINIKIENSRKVLDYIILFYQKNLLIKIPIFENLYHLSCVILSILHKIKDDKAVFYYLYQTVNFSEKTIYLDPKNFYNKCYLSKLISSKNKTFNSKELWSELIKYHIAISLREYVLNEINRIQCKKINKNKQILSKVKNMFSFSVIEENLEYENEVLYYNLCKLRQSKVTAMVIEDFLHHFSHFNFESNSALDLVIDCCNRSNLVSQYINYFTSIYNSNFFPTKREGSLSEINDYKMKISEIYFNEKFSKFRRKIKNIDNNSIIFFNCLKFCNFQDMIKILCLNKEIYKNFKGYIYHNILLKYNNIDMNKRLMIWKNILELNEYKKKYNYFKLLEEFNAGNNIIPNDIIDLDVARTHFNEDSENNKKKITNILRLARKQSKIDYSQGMNYIAAFLLLITNNEEDAFYLMLSLLQNTEYGLLFKNSLENLRKYFYVFERLIKIYLPEIELYLNKCGVNISAFVTSWFITMYTNSFNYSKNNKEPKILIKIWELFFYQGWQAIFKAGILILTKYEYIMLNKNSEELLCYLLNEITKSDFFDDENLNMLIFFDSNIYIDECLIANIVNEYDIKQKYHLNEEENK